MVLVTVLSDFHSHWPYYIKLHTPRPPPPSIYDVVLSPKHTQKFLPIHFILILSRAIASLLYPGLFYLFFGKNKPMQKYV